VNTERPGSSEMEGDPVKGPQDQKVGGSMM
jgi:hypothetical protein